MKLPLWRQVREPIVDLNDRSPLQYILTLISKYIVHRWAGGCKIRQCMMSPKHFMDSQGYLPKCIARQWKEFLMMINPESENIKCIYTYT